MCGCAQLHDPPLAPSHLLQPARAPSATNSRQKGKATDEKQPGPTDTHHRPLKEDHVSTQSCMSFHL